MLRLGSRGKAVKEIQEWLCLHGIFITIDGIFGPATEFAVKMFKQTITSPWISILDGKVDEKTIKALRHPLTEVKNFPKEYKTNMTSAKLQRTLMLDIAKKHLKNKPREVGGENMGPWVRFYTKGYEGNQYPWCAAFVSKIIEQTIEILRCNPLEFEYTLSCDRLAVLAHSQGALFTTPKSKPTNNIPIKPFPKRGQIFLIRRTSTDWVHTGIVTKVHNDCFETIEGNTNDTGSREGYKVCKRIRSYKKVDFIDI